MKRITAMVAFLLCMVLILSACSGANSGTFLELRLCGAYAVPGMFMHDLKGSMISQNVLEQDTQGRILFELTATNVITENEMCVVVICQAIDDDYVYFYEDRCYLMPEYSDSDIETLKKENDWNQALDYDQMSRRPNRITVDLYISTTYDEFTSQELRKACYQALNIEQSQWLDVDFLDGNPDGSVICFVKTQPNQGAQKFFVMISADGDAVCCEITDDVAIKDTLVTFKQDNDWLYGF